MDLAAPGFPDLDEPARWRKAALVSAAIAGVELVALVVIALAFIAKPFAEDAESAAAEPAPAATAPAPADAAVEAPAAAAPAADGEPAAPLPRTKTPVLVLNGNGVTGAAGAAAQVVESLRYPVAGVGDASRRDFARTIVMYREGLEREARRLARDMGLAAGQAVPLDGMRPRQLGGAKLVLIVGG